MWIRSLDGGDMAVVAKIQSGWIKFSQLAPFIAGHFPCCEVEDLCTSV